MYAPVWTCLYFITEDWAEQFYSQPSVKIHNYFFLLELHRKQMNIKLAEIGNRQQKLSNFVNFLFEI
jgi:hypothetical protein